MNAFRIFIGIFLWIQIQSCQRQFEQKRTLVEVGEKTFDIGFYGKIKLLRIHGEEYIGHADFTTHKKILLHSITGHNRVVIPLDKVLNETEKIVAFEVVDWDHIMVMPAYSTALFIIDTLGDINGKIDFAPYLEQAGHYALVCHTGSFIFNDTSMVFALEYLAENVAGEYTSWLAELKAYDEGLYHSPRLFKVDHFGADTFSVHFGANSLYQRFSAEDVLAYGRSNFRFINHQIFFTNMYTDSLYVIDPNTLTVKQSIGIRSKYTDLVLDHMTREEAILDPERFMYNSMSNGNIRDILYDGLSQHYFVGLVHAPKSKELTASLDSWSFVVLDQAFNYVDEIYMDYAAFGLTHLPSKQGIYLLNTAQGEGSLYDQYRYSIFQYR